MSEGPILLAGVIAAALLVGLGVAAEIQEKREWEAFKEAQHCRVIGKMKGEFFNTFDGKNVGVGYTGDKVGWACDDGQQYWR